MTIEQPAGTITLFFSDIEGSTQLLHTLGPVAYREALSEHRQALREAFARHGGYEVDYQGDAFFVAFPDAREAIAAAEEGQCALAGGPIKVRMGLHTGEPLLDPPKYVGVDVHLAARVMSAGHGGQVLLTSATQTAAGLCDNLSLGEQRLKDIDGPVELFQLGDERFPPLKTISNTNLPRPASSFVGRAREAAEVVALLQESRLVTLTGPGGTGKTRLAIEAAAELVGEFKAGVFWVGLATLRDPTLVVETIARDLGTRDLAGHVGEREMLLLLDNFEQVVDAAPELSALLQSCPNLRVLVTSRELLRIDGEVQYAVPPLASSEAVELFCARARLDPDDAIAELCRRLDEMPLAVELAAARTAVLTPAQILDRLSQRLDLLKGGRDADPRQRTLRATIEWSHELLAPDEQRAFAALSVFAGGCTLEAAEQVAGADLDVLQSLVEKSLVRHTDERFWMLETIREYAAERLEASGRGEEIRRSLAERLVDVLASANFSLESEGGERHDLVVPELSNLRAALQWAVEADPELGARLLLAVEQFWVFTSPFEARRWLDDLLARGPYEDDVQARLLAIYGGLIFIVGDFEDGDRYHHEATEIFRRIGDERSLAVMLGRLAVGANMRGDRGRARELCEASLSLARPLGYRKATAQALLVFSYVEFAEGRPDEGMKLADEAADRAREIGWSWWEVGSLLQGAECAARVNGPLGDGGRARRCLEAAQAIGDRQHSIYALALLAWAAASAGDAGKAGRLWGAIEAEAERGPIGQWEAECEQYAERVLAVAGPDLEAGRAEGRRLTLPEAAELALSLD